VHILDYSLLTFVVVVSYDRTYNYVNVDNDVMNKTWHQHYNDMQNNLAQLSLNNMNNDSFSFSQVLTVIRKVQLQLKRRRTERRKRRGE